MSRFKRVGVLHRQIRAAESRRDEECSFASANCLIPCFQEKPLSFSL